MLLVINRWRAATAVVVALLLSMPTCADALTVRGQVRDAQGRPAVGVEVRFVSQAVIGETVSVHTDTAGFYRAAVSRSTNVMDAVGSLPAAHALLPNYPNPFNPSTRLRYQVGLGEHVRLRIYNALGQAVYTLVDAPHEPGHYAVDWDGRLASGRGAAAGVYIVRLESAHAYLTRKITLLDGSATRLAAPKRAQDSPEAYRAYRVHIRAPFIEPFDRDGLHIAADTSLDFSVERYANFVHAVPAGSAIGAVLARAVAGDTLALAAGTYAEQQIALRPGVALRGAGRGRTALVDSYLLAEGVDSVHVRDLTLRAGRVPGRSAVELSQGYLALLRCRIENEMGPAIELGSGGQLVAQESELDAAAAGIALRAGPGTQIDVRQSRLDGGVYMAEGARGQLVGNRLRGAQHGLQLIGAQAQVRANTFVGIDRRYVGIRTMGEAEVALIDNAVSGYAAGIQVVGPSAPEMSDNRLSDNAVDVQRVSVQTACLDELALGMQQLKSGRFQHALTTFFAAGQLAPFEQLGVQALFYMAVSHMRMDYFAGAIPLLEQVLDMDPEHPLARWHRRLCALKIGGDPGTLPDRYRFDMVPMPPPLRPPVRFEDVAPQAGVDQRSMGRGSAWRDMDGDGWLDLITVEDDGPHKLYRNRSDGTFVDIAEQAGIADPLGGWSALWVDYDNDGDGDLFVTRDGFSGLSRNTLFRNRGDGTFADVTDAVGLGEVSDSFCAAWGDYDNDGRVDLYIGNGIAQKGAPNALYRNNLDGPFSDVTRAAGVANGLGATIGVSWGDYDNDGWLDLYAANNGMDNALYHNGGDGVFEDRAREAGVTEPVFGFVSFFIDYDNDGWLDLFVSNNALWLADVIRSAQRGGPGGFEGNRSFFYRNRGDGTFVDIAPGSGLDRTLGTMAATYGDVDNDGYVDLYLANGGPTMDRFEPDLIMASNGDGTFAEISAYSGLYLTGKGHGPAMGDYDNDGDLDIYSPQGGVGGNAGNIQPNHLLRNRGTDGGWLVVQLEGRASNRDAVGAVVIATIGERVHRATVDGGSGFGVTNSLPIELGLGAARQVDHLRIDWPSGQTDYFYDVEANQVLRVVEGSTQN